MKLKASERRLLAVFLSLLAVVVGGFGTALAARYFGGAAAEVRALEERRDSLVRMLRESEMWGARSAWIGERIPGFETREEASSELLDSVSEAAESAGVEIRNKQLIIDPNAAAEGRAGEAGVGEAAGGRYFDRVAVVMELAGEEEKMVRWLHEVQRPDSFLGVTHLTYGPEKGGVRCHVQVSLWFREMSRPNLAGTRL